MKKGAKTPKTPGRCHCEWCHSDKFHTNHALQQHLETSFCAKLRAHAARGQHRPNSPGINSGSASDSGDDANGTFASLEWNTLPDTPKKAIIPRMEIEGVDREEIGEVTIQIGEMLDEAGSDDESSDNSGNYGHIGVEEDPMGANAMPEDYSDSDYEEESEAEGTELSPMDENSTDSPDSGASGNNPVGPDQWIQGQF